MSTEKDKVVIYLFDQLTSLFPNKGVTVMISRLLGSEHINILYTDATVDSQCISNILENDRAFMRFMIWNAPGNGYYIEYPITHCGTVFDDGTVKFRKINAKTEQEAAVKLVAWFAKHREHILKCTNPIKA